MANWGDAGKNISQRKPAMSTPLCCRKNPVLRNMKNTCRCGITTVARGHLEMRNKYHSGCLQDLQDSKDPLRCEQRICKCIENPHSVSKRPNSCALRIHEEAMKQNCNRLDSNITSAKKQKTYGSRIPCKSISCYEASMTTLKR